MQHARLFRKLREERGLSLDALAAKARRHRNTIINLEAGRPVKFSTIAQLMEKMGYADDSAEMATMALLWVESVSGVALSSPTKLSNARQRLTAYQRDTQRLVSQLQETIRQAALTERQIKLLDFAAGTPEVMDILGSVHDLLQTGAAPDVPALKVAEDR